MRTALRRHSRISPQAATLLAALAAVIIAVGTTDAVAAAARLITGKGIKNESVTGTDIKNRSLTGADIKDGSLATADIAQRAITSAKLAAAAATADKIAAGAVTAEKIATGAATADKIAAGAVTAEKIAAGAVGTAQVADGSITAAKLASGVVPAYSAGSGLTLDGTQFSAKESPDTKTVYVAKSGGEFTSIQSALDSITDASASNPYVVKVGPGVFEERVALKGSVTVEGSGKDSTIIRSAGGATEAQAAVVTLAYGTALRDVWVDNTGGSQFAVAVMAPNNSYANVRDVLVTGATSGTATYALLLDEYASVYAWDLEVNSSSTLSPTNSGIRLQGASAPTLYLNRGQVSMSDGTNVRAVDIQSGAALINHSLLSTLNGANSSGLRLANATSAVVRWTEIESRSGSTSSASIRSSGGTVVGLSDDLTSNTDEGPTANLLFDANTTTATFHGSVMSGADSWIQADAVGTVRASASRLENGTDGTFVGLVTFNCGASVSQTYSPLSAGCV